jgi:23S rRNA (guanine2445-N2)-methyltransferase / 23S rRNA (guanine2069-N7)-methyltransferase
MENLTYFATAPKGMSDLLTTELTQLGATHVSETRAGAQFQGSMEVVYRACLWSRLANRILLPLATFPAETPEALYDGVKAIDWSAHMSVNQTLAVDANVSASAITHSHYAALKIKDAIVDTFAESHGDRPNVDVDRPDIRVNCYLHRDQAALYLDLSGSSLHQRNYRLQAGQAPLKENLAAALLLRARWPEMVLERGAFVDPMCGSGTLVIEAAMLAADMAPGLGRDYFGFLGWRQHDAELWARLVAEAEQRREVGLKHMPTMLGFDYDRRVLDVARENAQRAGLADHISFAFQDVADFRHDFPPRGLMLTNPPYGRRLAETDELPGIYRALGRMMRSNLKGWNAAVFTEDQALGKHLGIRAGKLHTLFNGAIACKLIHFSVEPSQFYRDARLPRRARPEDLSDQALMFKNRLEKNLKQLSRWVRRESVSCYRLYDADLPDYAAAIDIYCGSRRGDETSGGDSQGGRSPAGESPEADSPWAKAIEAKAAATKAAEVRAPVVAEPFVPEQWVCVQEYAAPQTIDAEKAKLRTSELLTIVQQVLGTDDDHLFYKTRARQRGEKQYERLATERRFHQVSEGASQFLVNFEDYLDTGLFLDHRPIRQRIYQEAREKTFLNLFAYTGAVTVQAALGGALSSTTVDMSQTYLDWARRNFQLNGLNEDSHQLVQADCLQWLSRARPGEHYDLIFLDPPTFSNSKRMAQTFDVQVDHGVLIRQAMGLLRPDGVLYFSTNMRNFKLDENLQTLFSAKNISAETIPPDFKRRQNIHHCWAIRAN